MMFSSKKSAFDIHHSNQDKPVVV